MNRKLLIRVFIGTTSAFIPAIILMVSDSAGKTAAMLVGVVCIFVWYNAQLFAEGKWL